MRTSEVASVMSSGSPNAGVVTREERLNTLSLMRIEFYKVPLFRGFPLEQLEKAIFERYPHRAYYQACFQLVLFKVKSFGAAGQVVLPLPANLQSDEGYQPLNALVNQLLFQSPYFLAVYKQAAPPSLVQVQQVQPPQQVVPAQNRNAPVFVPPANSAGANGVPVSNQTSNSNNKNEQDRLKQYMLEGENEQIKKTCSFLYKNVSKLDTFTIDDEKNINKCIKLIFTIFPDSKQSLINGATPVNVPNEAEVAEPAAAAQPAPAQNPPEIKKEEEEVEYFTMEERLCMSKYIASKFYMSRRLFDLVHADAEKEAPTEIDVEERNRIAAAYTPKNLTEQYVQKYRDCGINPQAQPHLLPKEAKIRDDFDSVLVNVRKALVTSFFKKHLEVDISVDEKKDEPVISVTVRPRKNNKLYIKFTVDSYYFTDGVKDIETNTKVMFSMFNANHVPTVVLKFIRALKGFDIQIINRGEGSIVSKKKLEGPTKKRRI